MLGAFVAAGCVHRQQRAAPPAGGRSLYRITRNGAEEVAEGVRDMQVDFLQNPAVSTMRCHCGHRLEHGAGTSCIDITFEGPGTRVCTRAPPRAGAQRWLHRQPPKPAAMNSPLRRTQRRSRQQGISLIVSLVLLVVVALLAVGSMRGVGLQARMSGTTTDRNLAFQAAEVALREAEHRAIDAWPPTFRRWAAPPGFAPRPDPADGPRWLDTAFAAGWRRPRPRRSTRRSPKPSSRPGRGLELAPAAERSAASAQLHDPTLPRQRAQHRRRARHRRRPEPVRRALTGP